MYWLNFLRQKIFYRVEVSELRNVGGAKTVLAGLIFFVVSVIPFINKTQFFGVLLTFSPFRLDMALLNLNLTEIGTGNNNGSTLLFSS